MYTFQLRDCLFRIDAQDGVVAHYNDKRETTTVFNVYVHDVHSTVSDAVERDGLWVPVITLHWREVTDTLDGDVLGPNDVTFDMVEKFIRKGNYGDLIKTTSKI